MKIRSMVVVGALMIVIATAFLYRRVNHDEPESTPQPAQTTGIVPFRMEQQWLVRLKLAQAEQSELPSQIYSVGRVIASPLNRAVVSPPVGGLIENRPLPRLGQRVKRGEVLATLAQVPPLPKPRKSTSRTVASTQNAAGWVRQRSKCAPG
jgi:multidrug efflux pump subunit AcrA (membrane-fusion protein)